jgi:hypothetical protein
MVEADNTPDSVHAKCKTENPGWQKPGFITSISNNGVTLRRAALAITIHIVLLVLVPGLATLSGRVWPMLPALLAARLPTVTLLRTTLLSLASLTALLALAGLTLLLVLLFHVLHDNSPSESTLCCAFAI